MKNDDVQMSLALDPLWEAPPDQSHSALESPAPVSILIEIAEVPITGTEVQKYSATLVKIGEVIIAKSRCPAFDACQVLLDRGITGTVHTRRKGSDTISMKLNIEQGARMDVREGYSDPPRIVQYDAQKREEDRARLARLRKRD